MVKLVQENNSIEKLKEALSVKDDTIGFEYTPEMAKVDAHEIARIDIEEDEEESESDDSSKQKSLSEPIVTIRKIIYP